MRRLETMCEIVIEMKEEYVITSRVIAMRQIANLDNWITYEKEFGCSLLRLT